MTMPDQAAHEQAGEAGQAAVIGLLKNPATYGAVQVDHIVTHAAHVFLAGDRAFKLKRAVKYSFLDFSGPGQRHWALIRELNLNRRTAPDLYLEILPVTETGGGLALGGTGPVRDWVLVMRRFDDAGLFDHMARDGRLTPALIAELGDQIAAFHTGLAAVRENGGAARMRREAGDVLAALGPCIGPIFDPDLVDRLRHDLFAALDHSAALLDRRRDQGFVRYCHGDMHLGNICLWRGKPTPFDCIEFNDDIACADLLHDLAFPVMDLVFFDRRALANLLMNRYLEVMRDYQGLGAFSFFLAARAIIRAMATGLAANSQRPAEFARPRRYLGLAAAFLQPVTPRLIAVGGLSGSGKSSLVQALALKVSAGTGAVIVRSDGIRKRLQGVSPEQKLPPEAYQPEVNARVYRRLHDDVFEVLRSGQVAIADAAHLRQGERDAVADIALEAGVPFTGLWLDVPAPIARQRISARTGGASDADLGVLERQLGYDLGPIRWHRLDASGAFDDTLDEALAKIGE